MTPEYLIRLVVGLILLILLIWVVFEVVDRLDDDGPKSAPAVSVVSHR